MGSAEKIFAGCWPAADADAAEDGRTRATASAGLGSVRAEE